MSFYTDMQTTADEMIDEFGRTVTYKTVGTAATDPLTPWKVTVSEGADQEIKAVFEEVDRYYPGGEVTLKVQKKALISHTSLGDAPVISAKLVDGSVEYTVQEIKEISPGDTGIYYELFLSR